MKKQNVRTLSLIVLTMTYLLIGAAIFDKIESGEEQNQSVALKVLENQIMDKYNFTEVDFKLMEEAVLLYKPYKAGKPWRFAGSFYYATTVLTTIGYGHSTPKTPGGKIFTMLYATIGIPLGLIMFNSIGERLNKFSSLIINSLRRSLKAKQEETTEADLIIVVMFLSSIILCVGSWVFSQYEGWSYFDSMYYCFTTITTIGFGDLVALQQDNALEEKPEYVTFALFFIMFGLAVIAALLNLMVLRFMTMNTEDERQDEIEAIQAAAYSVRVEGDIIMGDILNDAKYRERCRSTSAEDVRSVCSCSCISCHPFFNRFRNHSGDLRSPPPDFSDYVPSPPKSRPSSVHDLRSLRLIPYGGFESYDLPITRNSSKQPKTLVHRRSKLNIRELEMPLTSRLLTTPSPNTILTTPSPRFPLSMNPSPRYVFTPSFLRPHSTSPHFCLPPSPPSAEGLLRPPPSVSYDIAQIDFNRHEVSRMLTPDLHYKPASPSSIRPTYHLHYNPFHDNSDDCEVELQPQSSFYKSHSRRGSV